MFEIFSRDIYHYHQLVRFLLGYHVGAEIFNHQLCGSFPSYSHCYIIQGKTYLNVRLHRTCIYERQDNIDNVIQGLSVGFRSFPGIFTTKFVGFKIFQSTATVVYLPQRQEA